MSSVIDIVFERDVAGYEPEDRYVVAVEPSAVGVNIAGQSGQPGSPWFADQVEDWAGEGYHPLEIRRDAVEETGRTAIEPG